MARPGETAVCVRNPVDEGETAMEISVSRHQDWLSDVYLRDEPHGNNAVVLKPLQVRVLLDEANVPLGQPVVLPQPDATCEAITVVRWPQSWHVLRPGAELSIAAADWPTVREQIRAIAEAEEE